MADRTDESPSVTTRTISVPPDYSLAETCAPAAWGGSRWPSHAWMSGAFVWVGWEDDEVVWRAASQPAPGQGIEIRGTASPARDREWASAVLGIEEQPPTFDDPVIERLRLQFPGLRPYAAGSLYEGLVSSIVGQSISVASAAVTETRLAALFHEGIVLFGRRFYPLPCPNHLASAEPAVLRTSGVTMRRAEALVAVGRAALDGSLPFVSRAGADPDHVREVIRRLPLVGPWTAESALLWGLGLSDAYPVGDVALLRAARFAYGEPDLAQAVLDTRAKQWSPARAWATRYLWTHLLGVAPPAPGPGDLSP